MIQFDKNYADDSILLFIINPKNDWSRGPVLFCFNLLVICFQKRNTPCKKEFPEVKIRRQVLDHYLARKSNIASHYDILIIENVPPRSTNQPPHRIKTGDIELGFSKNFTEYLNNIQQQNSQRVDSIFTNDFFSIIYCYTTLLEPIETFYVSPPQTSWHSIEQREFKISLHNF